MSAAGDEGDLVAPCCEPGAEVASDTSCPHDGYAQDVFLPVWESDVNRAGAGSAPAGAFATRGLTRRPAYPCLPRDQHGDEAWGGQQLYGVQRGRGQVGGAEHDQAGAVGQEDRVQHAPLRRLGKVHVVARVQDRGGIGCGSPPRGFVVAGVA
jgi:hypothetical protein